MPLHRSFIDASSKLHHLVNMVKRTRGIRFSLGSRVDKYLMTSPEIQSKDTVAGVFSAILGWCVEVVRPFRPFLTPIPEIVPPRKLQAFFLVADDIIDWSFTRRGQLCWSRSVCDIAINDAFMLEALRLRYTTCSSLISVMNHLMSTFWEFPVRCVCRAFAFTHSRPLRKKRPPTGQLIDLIAVPEDVVNLGKFYLEK